MAKNRAGRPRKVKDIDPDQPRLTKQQRLKRMTDCELGRHRTDISNDIDAQMLNLALAIRESKRRGLTSTGVVGICTCKNHVTNEYHVHDDKEGISHDRCWSGCEDVMDKWYQQEKDLYNSLQNVWYQ